MPLTIGKQIFPNHRKSQSIKIYWTRKKGITFANLCGYSVSKKQGVMERYYRGIPLLPWRLRRCWRFRVPLSSCRGFQCLQSPHWCTLHKYGKLQVKMRKICLCFHGKLESNDINTIHATRVPYIHVFNSRCSCNDTKSFPFICFTMNSVKDRLFIFYHDCKVHSHEFIVTEILDILGNGYHLVNFVCELPQSSKTAALIIRWCRMEHLL